MKTMPLRNARRAVQVVLATGVALGATQAVAATDLFLKITGLPGESTDSKHKDEIELSSFSQSIDNKNCGQLTVTKNVDRASPGLADAAARKFTFGSATLVARRAGVKDAVEYYTLTLSNLTVGKVDQAFSQDQAGTEQVAISSQNMTISYRPQKPDGSLDTPVVSTLTCKNKD
jgi:type VI secretion system secreted protein Hcp